MFGLTKQRLSKAEPEMSEFGSSETGDILVNPHIFGELNGIESSLTKYLQYLYVEYPQWVRVSINGKLIDH